MTHELTAIRRALLHAGRHGFLPALAAVLRVETLDVSRLLFIALGTVTPTPDERTALRDYLLPWYGRLAGRLRCLHCGRTLDTPDDPASRAIGDLCTTCAITVYGDAELTIGDRSALLIEASL
jgi:hypothetical protein